ncbi:Mu transposase domain-containing protein [Streptomyces sp. NPDC001153]
MEPAGRRTRECRPDGRGPRSARTSPVKVDRTLYSVPWRPIEHNLDVRSTATVVQILHDGRPVTPHTALGQGKRTDKSDYRRRKSPSRYACRSAATVRRPRTATRAAMSSTSC